MRVPDVGSDRAFEMHLNHPSPEWALAFSSAFIPDHRQLSAAIRQSVCTLGRA